MRLILSAELTLLLFGPAFVSADPSATRTTGSVRKTEARQEWSGSPAVAESGIPARPDPGTATEQPAHGTIGGWVEFGPAPIGHAPNSHTGRIAALAAHPSDANTIYVASATGEIWKTEDGGGTWRALTDDQPTLIMRVIALAPSDEKTIYAGTGEANNTSDCASGRGILKSTTSGALWGLLGSDKISRRAISRIVVHPTDPKTVYVAVARAADGLAGNLGIWKSIDGGTMWNNTTSTISTNLSFSDLVMDPSDDQTLYAAVGEKNGSTKNGVYKTVNAGGFWTVAGDFRIDDSRNGRIALAIAPSRRQVLYAPSVAIMR